MRYTRHSNVTKKQGLHLTLIFVASVILKITNTCNKILQRKQSEEIENEQACCNFLFTPRRLRATPLRGKNDGNQK